MAKAGEQPISATPAGLSANGWQGLQDTAPDTGAAWTQRHQRGSVEGSRKRWPPASTSAHARAIPAAPARGCSRRRGTHASPGRRAMPAWCYVPVGGGPPCPLTCMPGGWCPGPWCQTPCCSGSGGRGRCPLPAGCRARPHTAPAASCGHRGGGRGGPGATARRLAGARQAADRQAAENSAGGPGRTEAAGTALDRPTRLSACRCETRPAAQARQHACKANQAGTFLGPQPNEVTGHQARTARFNVGELPGS